MFSESSPLKINQSAAHKNRSDEISEDIIMDKRIETNSLSCDSETTNNTAVTKSRNISNDLLSNSGSTFSSQNESSPFKKCTLSEILEHSSN